MRPALAERELCVVCFSVLLGRVYDPWCSTSYLRFTRPVPLHSSTRYVRHPPQKLLETIIAQLWPTPPSRALLSAHIAFLVGTFCREHPELRDAVQQHALFLRTLFLNARESTLAFLLGILLSTSPATDRVRTHALLHVLAFSRGHAKSGVDFQIVLPSLVAVLLDDHTKKRGRALVFESIYLLSVPTKKVCVWVGHHLRASLLYVQSSLVFLLDSKLTSTSYS